MIIPANLTYEEVERRHPEQLAKLIQTLRNSKSKMKDADPKDMKFEYGYAMSCGISYRGDEFFERLAKGTLEKTKRPETVEGKIADWKERATPVTLSAKLGRWYGYERVPNPPEFDELLRRNAEKEVARETSIANMSDDEREAETEKLLKELSGMGGFIGVRIG